MYFLLAEGGYLLQVTASRQWDCRSEHTVCCIGGKLVRFAGAAQGTRLMKTTDLDIPSAKNADRICGLDMSISPQSFS